MNYPRLTRLGIVLLTLVVSATVRPAIATVIFEENFALRNNGAGIFGSFPNVTNTNNAPYLRGPELAGHTLGTVGYYGFVGSPFKGLLFKPEDAPGEQLAGSWGQNMYLPFNYTFGTDRAKLTLSVRKETSEWNNFSFGFVDGNGNLSNFILLQRVPSGNFPERTQTQLFHNGQQYYTNHRPGAYAQVFQELSLEYDPAKANVPGVNPYTFLVNGEVMDRDQATIPGSDNINSVGGPGLPAMTSIGGVGWGFWFANGALDRSALIESMKFEILPPDTTPGLDGDYNVDGTVDAADYVIFRKGITGDYNTWRQNFGRTASGSGGQVPEPMAATLVGLAISCLALIRRR